MIYEHPVEPPRERAELPETERQVDHIRDFTQRCTDVLEMYVRRHPHFWLWMHRRWRDTEPAAEGVPGMFPAAERDIE
jgi:lauroyl/myristoyl acyltransferase